MSCILAAAIGTEEHAAQALADPAEDNAIEQEVLRAIRENESDGQYLDVRFDAKTQVEPLQAADIAVYEMCKEVARILGHHQRERRKLMSRVEERYKHWGYMDDEEVARFMEKNAHLLTGPATGEAPPT